MEKNKLYQVEEFHNLKELLNFASSKYANNIAFKFKKNITDKTHIEKTYLEFKTDIDYMGTALFNLDLQEKRIAIISPNRYEWAVSYLSITTGNMVVVPLDKSLPENEIEGLISRSKAECIIFDKNYLNTLKKVKQENKTNLKYYICMDFEKEEDGILSFRELLQKGKQLVEKGDIRHINTKIDENKMSMMLFTSGTTAISKAVMLSHSNLCSNVNAIRSVVKIYENDVFLSFLPLHHTFETIAFIYAIASGAAIAYCDGLKYISKNLEEYKITALVCVPLMLETMFKKIQKGIKDGNKENLINIMTKISKFFLKVKIDLRRVLFKTIIKKMGGHLRLIVSGAAAISKETVEGFSNFGINLIQGYGLTETSPVLCVENDKYKRAGSVGFPLNNLSLKIDNPNENGVGEIIAKGPNVMMGYYENEEATEEVLKDGWFYTGDLGYIDEDGYVYISGRKKTVIVLKNGKNIFPEEVEMLINNLSFVTESMIYGKKTEDNDLKLAVKIVYNKEIMQEMFKGVKEEQYYEIIKEEIKKINKTMPPYKYIRDIIITEEPLIKTTTQKIKRHEEIQKLSA